MKKIVILIIVIIGTSIFLNAQINETYMLNSNDLTIQQTGEYQVISTIENFNKMTAGSNNYYGSTFDFNSIMLYSSFAFAKTVSSDPADATLTKKDGTIFTVKSDISETDKNVIRQMYP